MPRNAIAVKGLATTVSTNQDAKRAAIRTVNVAELYNSGDEKGIRITELVDSMAVNLWGVSVRVLNIQRLKIGTAAVTQSEIRKFTGLSRAGQPASQAAPDTPCPNIAPSSNSRCSLPDRP